MADAYGWTDLDRVRALNHERYAQEVAQGLRNKKNATQKKQTKGIHDKQAELF